MYGYQLADNLAPFPLARMHHVVLTKHPIGYTVSKDVWIQSLYNYVMSSIDLLDNCLAALEAKTPHTSLTRQHRRERKLNLLQSEEQSGEKRELY